LYFKRSIYLISVLLTLVLQQGLSQSYTQIDGIINGYTAIETIECRDENNVDSVVVSDLTGFGEGDTVMIYCVQGAKIVTETSVDFPEFKDIGGDALEPRSTGRYAFLIINEIYVPGRVVVFNNKVTPDINTLGDGEVAQLIKVKSYRNVEVTPAGVWAEEWDPATGTGGVVAMFASVLKLNGNIDVSGAGFTGAAEHVDYLHGCSSDNPTELDSLFYQNSNFSAGKKGEGTTDTRFDRLRGKAKNINGGGGGNGLFSGGGGGSNYSPGGNGGDESSQCNPGILFPGGQGGFEYVILSYYKNYYGKDSVSRGWDRYDRFFFGGGGGSGTRKPGINTSNGADGGGAVIIIADSIIGNGNAIIANGLDALDAEGAAGGGGGGGSILLDVNGYRTPLNLSARGGNGGNTIGTDTTGPGGGGGGGIYWVSGDLDNHTSLQMETAFGQLGLYQGTHAYGAGNGGEPGDKDELVAPIRGFVFNPVPNEFTVCSDQVPDPIYASEPRGGDGPEVGYTYVWVDSSSTQQEWLEAPGGPGVVDQQNYYFPGPLSDTTYFRRVVYSGALPADTSFRIAVYVHQAIDNNTISAPDTVCYGDAANLFIPSIIGGGLGTGTHTYLWQKDEGPGSEPAEGANTDSTYQTPGLTTSTNFTRIAKSGVCVDTSNALFVQVWEKHANYQITDNDTVCYNIMLPNELTSLSGLPPENGDTLDIRYQWITSPDKTSWADISGATAESYQPPLQTQDTYYSRIVLSGSDNACVDTSDYKEILNINLIENNTIADTRTVCTADEGGLMTGSDPTGGLDDVQFSYTWEVSTKTSGWVTVDSSFSKIDYDPGIMEGDTTWFRRKIGAGGVARNVCISYSNEDTIHVLPPVTNNLITTSDSMKCEDDLLEWLMQDASNGSTPIGGDASWIYQWQVSTGTGEPGTWGDIEGATSIDYLDQPQLDGDNDRWYRRRVFSGPNDVCQDYSDTIHVTVHTGITGNTIDPLDSACFNSNKVVLGALPLGEEGLMPTYTWRDAVTGADLPGIQGQNYSDTFRLQQLYQFERETRFGACTDTSNTMLITVMQLPGGMLSGDISRSCETNVMLDVALSTGGLDNYILPWNVYLKDGVNAELIGPYPLNANGEVEVLLNTDTDSTQFNYTIGEITYSSVTDRYECVSPPDQLSGTVPIKVFRTPEPQITVDGAARESFKVCNTTVSLEADTDRGIGVWTFNPSNYISASANSGNAYLISIPNSTEAFGTYRATFTSTAGVCSGVDSIDLYYFEQPDKPDVGLDTVLFLINEVELKASEPTAGYGEWTVNPSGPIIEDKDSPHTIARNLELNAENIFTWTVRNGEDEGECIDTSDFKVVIRTEVKKYQGFSPNGDMDNEYFIMQGLMYADEYTITFFNSLGNTVRTITNENIDQVEYDPNLIMDQREDELVVWDGRSENGTIVPNGTYYYVVHYIKDGIDYPYKDYVVVLKD